MGRGPDRQVEREWKTDPERDEAGGERYSELPPGRNQESTEPTAWVMGGAWRHS
jgi:hypothetical protein